MNNPRLSSEGRRIAEIIWARYRAQGFITRADVADVLGKNVTVVDYWFKRVSDDGWHLPPITRQMRLKNWRRAARLWELAQEFEGIITRGEARQVIHQHGQILDDTLRRIEEEGIPLPVVVKGRRRRKRWRLRATTASASEGNGKRQWGDTLPGQGLPYWKRQPIPGTNLMRYFLR